MRFLASSACVSWAQTTSEGLMLLCMKGIDSFHASKKTLSSQFMIAPLLVLFLYYCAWRQVYNSQLLRTIQLNQTPWGGGGQYDNGESYTIGGGGEPRAGETYGVAGTDVPRLSTGWFPETGSQLNSWKKDQVRGSSLDANFIYLFSPVSWSSVSWFLVS